MITFRQKEFIAPIIAALAPAVIQGGAGIVQGKKANESQERIARQQQVQAIKDRKAQERQANMNAKLQNQQLKAAQKQQNQLIKLAKQNPQAAAAVKPTITVGQNQDSTKTFSKVSNVLGGVYNVGVGALNSGAITTAMGMKMSKDQNKANESIAAKENATRQLETAARIKENNNATAIKMQELSNARNEFNKSYRLARKQKTYSKTKEAAGFIKNLGTIAKDRGVNRRMAGALVSGAIAGGGAYLVDKAIQKDIKKSKVLKIEKPEETQEEKIARKKKRNRKIAGSVLASAALVGTGVAAKKGKLGKDAKDIASKITAKSVGNKLKDGARTVGEATKDYFAPINEKTGKRRPDYLNLGLTALSTAAPAVMYLQKKKAIKDQIKQSEGRDEEDERTYSKKGGIDFKKLKKKLDEFRETGENAYFQRDNKPGKKSYKGGAADIPLRARTSNLGKPKGQTHRMKAKDWIKDFKKKPGETLLGTLSFRTGGGGRKGVSRFGKDLEKLGKETGNKTSQKVGKFVQDNPKTALLGSAALGYGVLRVARNKLSGATSKAIEKVDPNAFAYAKYGAQPIHPMNDEEEYDEQ